MVYIQGFPYFVSARWDPSEPPLDCHPVPDPEAEQERRDTRDRMWLSTTAGVERGLVTCSECHQQIATRDNLAALGVNARGSGDL
jgi:hypothetical protein